jgi:methylenetetrahydrofolate reductase (NADPH)
MAPTRGGPWPATRLELIPLRGIEEHFDLLPTGATVAITSSPRFGLERTLEYAERLAAAGMDPVPHLAAKHFVDCGHVRDVIARLRQAGVRDVFTIGGDGEEVAGAFRTGEELVAALAEIDHGLERIGVAAYPDGHPLIDDEVLLAALLRKQAHAQYLVTQMCFDPQVVARWLGKLRQLGVVLPAYLGVAGPVRRTKLMQIALRLGVRQSARFAAKQQGLLSRLVRPGSYRPADFVSAIARLTRDAPLDVRGYQVFTFNELAATMKWQESGRS